MTVLVALGIGAAGCLPVPALAQIAAPVDEQIKQLQSEIRNTQKHYETEIRNIQKQHATEIRNLQRQLDDLKAAQAAPKPSPPSAPGARPLCRFPRPQAYSRRRRKRVLLKAIGE